VGCASIRTLVARSRDVVAGSMERVQPPLSRQMSIMPPACENPILEEQGRAAGEKKAAVRNEGARPRTKCILLPSVTDLAWQLSK